MKKLVLFFAFIVSNAYANNIDSKLDLLYNKYSQYLDKDKDKAIKIAIDRLNLSMSIANFKQMAKSYEMIAYCYQANGNYELSLENYLYAVKYYSSEADTLGIISSYLNIGYNYNKVELPDKSIEYSERVLYFLKFKKNPEFLKDCYTNLARSYRIKGRHLLELEYLFKTNPSTPRDYNNIGTAFWKLAKYDSAHIYYSKAVAISIQSKDSANAALSLNNLGINYFSRDNHQEAIKCHQQALKYKKEEGKSYLELSNCYIAIGDLKLSEYYFNLAYRTFNDMSQIVEVMETLSNYLIKNNDHCKATAYLKVIINLKDSIQSMNITNYDLSYKSKYKMEEIETKFSHNQNLDLYYRNLEYERKIVYYQLALLIIIALTIIVVGIHHIVKMNKAKSSLDRLEKIVQRRN